MHFGAIYSPKLANLSKFYSRAQNILMASECILGLCPCCKLLQWIRAESGYQVHLKPFFINSAVKSAPISTFILANVTFAICYRPSVCLSSVCLSVVCNVRAPYSGGSNFRQYFYGIRYLGHLLTSTENFTEIVPGEPLRRGVKHKRGSKI